MAVVKLFLVGTAGSGKSTMVRGVKEWMNRQGYDAVTINLDPGAEGLPYIPDVDIRDWVKLEDVMDEYGLGPNGAQVAAADLLAMRAGDVKEVLESYKADYFLFDTPGQIELFTFREASGVILGALGRENSAIAFLFDPFLSRSASGYVSNLMLAATVQFRFYVPAFSVLSKADLLDEEEMRTIIGWSESHDVLYDSIMGEEASMRREVNVELLRALSSLNAGSKLFAVSAKELSGIEDLYNDIQQVFAGGEDIQK